MNSRRFMSDPKNSGDGILAAKVNALIGQKQVSRPFSSREAQMGQSRKWLRIRGMTALPPSRADIARPPRHVSFVSFAIFCTAEYGTLFNHPFGAGTAVIIRIQSPIYR
jgi:hypothetical protein